MKKRVIYHSKDFDGIFCREIAKKFIPDAEFIGWDYGDPKLPYPAEGTVYVLDLSPEFFLTRIVANVGLKHFWLGLAKAPVMAVVVAAIGCRHGFATGDDVDQLGRHVTSAVVQALFAILSIDAAFALLFMEMGL